MKIDFFKIMFTRYLQKEWLPVFLKIDVKIQFPISGRSNLMSREIKFAGFRVHKKPVILGRIKKIE
jgi:hypothetical protein